jgi:hypothetical protein
MKRSSGFDRRVYKMLRHEMQAAFQQYEAELKTILDDGNITVS